MPFTNQSLGFVSALEGFIFLSAFMHARVYGGTVNALDRLFMRSAKHAWRMYRYQLALVAGLALLTTISAVHRAALDNSPPYFTVPRPLLVDALLMLHEPMYLDILPVYIALTLLTPPILAVLDAGWVKSVLAVGVLAWLLGQVVQPVSLLVSHLCATCRQSPLSGFAWLSLWVLGLYLGDRYRRRQPFAPTRNIYAVAGCGIIAMSLFLLRHGFIAAGINLSAAADVATLGWLRLLNFAALGTLIAAALRRVSPGNGVPWLTLLGRASLPVFAFHLLLVYVSWPYRNHIFTSESIGLSVLLTGAAVASLTLPALAFRKYLAWRAVGPPPALTSSTVPS